MDALRELIDFALEFPENADVGSKGETNRLGEKADKELARLQAIATAAREADELIQYYIVGNKRIYSELNNEEKESIRKLAAALAALEQETK